MEPTESYPKKLFYKISEVAEIVGVEPYVLRYWETRFPMLRPGRFSNGERSYRRRDVEMLRQIRHLLYHEKFTIQGAIERLRCGPLEAEFGAGHPNAKLEKGAAVPLQLEMFPGQPGEATPIADAIQKLRQIRQEITDLTAE